MVEVVSLGNKKEQVELVKDLLELFNGQVEVLHLVQLQEVMTRK